MLIHAIRPRPAYLRVKIGRRLQKLGAVAIKNSVYALPCSESAREDLEWVVREIAADGGEASLCESRFVGGLTDAAIERQFRAARAGDYRALAQAVRRTVDGLAKAKRLSPRRRGLV
ncbi:MAG TPA: Chromate resistance protein ChrB, partial [Polyangia bacterium]|nr:Chromate resistance protein ChrB [Polyangia bacterium]